MMGGGGAGSCKVHVMQTIKNHTVNEQPCNLPAKDGDALGFKSIRMPLL